MDTLKPCPFCGSDDVNYWYEGQPARHMYVRCRDCHAIGPFIEVDCSGSGMPSDDQSRTINESITAWNKRTSEWVSVSDRLPDKIDIYYVAFQGGGVWFAYFNPKNTINKWIIENDKDKMVMMITHWMPLPLPPKGDE